MSPTRVQPLRSREFFGEITYNQCLRNSSSMTAGKRQWWVLFCVLFSPTLALYPLSRRRGFKWDEANLGEIEANKHVRQKITEPKTPYHPMMNDTDGSLSPIGGSDSFLEGDDNSNIRLNADAIRLALNEMASSSSNSNSHSGWTSSDDQDEADVMDHDLDDEGGKSARSFREKRKAHYDEYRKVKELQKKESMKKDDEKQSIVDGVGDINIKCNSHMKFERVGENGFSRLQGVWMLREIVISIVMKILTALCFPYVLS
ncbi:unnamed protein product [Lactuca saligna]|uniref:Protein phosphatase inhibitor 2 n=1 Tax=Lactuca saligna TaxID=75948 RepID=A0AA35ZSB3_LACSI|nr:unnamed protein product [Lactuca saligna]